MPVTATITVNDILKRVGAETGLQVDPDPFGSSKDEYIQLSSILQLACEDLALAADWEFLSKSHSIITATGDTGVYDLPEDLLCIKPGTEWNSSIDEPMPPLSAQQWNMLLAGDIMPVNWCYRIVGGKMHILPAPPAVGVTLTYEYLSRNIVQHSDMTYGDTLTAGDDIVLFDRTLITRYLKAKWLEAKGFDSTAAMNSFNQIFSFITSKDDSASTLNIGGNRGFRLLSMDNAPEDGYGL